MTHRRLSVLAAALVLTLVVGACGGDDGGDVRSDGSSPASSTTAAPSDGSSTTSGEAGEQTTASTGGEGGSSTTEGGDDGGDAGGEATGLAAVLLTVDDLPDGFTQRGGDVSSVDTGETGLCQGEPAAQPPTASEQIQRSFEKSDATSYLSSYALRTDTAALFQWYKDETDRCNAEDPDEGTYTVEDVSGIGDEAIRLVGTDQGGSADVLVARVGDVLVGVTAYAMPGVSLDLDSLLAISAARA